MPGPAADAAGQGGPPAGPFADLLKTEFISVSELAAVLRVSRMSVYRLLHEGEIPGAVRIGKRMFRIPSSGAVEYLKTCQFTQK